MTSFDGYTERSGGFLHTPGWAALFHASDAAIAAHAAVAGHPVEVEIKSKGDINYGQACCEDLDRELTKIELASARTCQACGAAGTSSGYLVECAAHRGQWPYSTLIPR